MLGKIWWYGSAMAEETSEQIMRQNLLAVAQTFAEANDWSLSTVSKQIHGNQAFLAEYLAGNVSTTIKTYFLMLSRLREKWPVDLQWPETRAVPGPKKVPYRDPFNMPPRGALGRFLGKKVHKRAGRT